MSSNEYYFNNLNYSLGNEDSYIEATLTKNARSVLCIAGSGSRVIPLLANNPKLLTVLDVSPIQLHFANVRIEAIKSLEFDEYLSFWGYKSLTPRLRKSLFHKISLSPQVKDFWFNRQQLWTEKGWHSLGRWENSLKKMGETFRNWFLFNPHPLFEAKNLEEQKSLNKIIWPNIRAKIFFKIAANSYVLNKHLYKGNLISPGYVYESNMSDFLLKNFIRLFNSTVARSNFFLQWVFLGEIKYIENSLPETNLNIYMKVKQSTTLIDYQIGFADTFSQNNQDYDAYSFSDLASYMGPDSIIRLLQKIDSSQLNKRAIFRSFYKHPQYYHQTKWTRLSDEEIWAYQNDCTGVYRFHIYEGNTQIIKNNSIGDLNKSSKEVLFDNWRSLS